MRGLVLLAGALAVSASVLGGLRVGSSGTTPLSSCPTITALRSRPGWPAAARPVALDGHGAILGITSTTTRVKGVVVFRERSFVWKDGLTTDLGGLGGAMTEAVAINNRGQIVGWSETKAHARHAFLWQRGTITDLGAFGGTSFQIAAVNDSLQVVGSVTRGGRTHAFLWQRGKIVDLETVRGATASAAAAINDRGEVVGSSTLADGTTRGFLWRQGKLTQLGAWAPAAINDAGEVAGDRFLWRDGRIRSLPSPSNAYPTRAVAIDDSSRVVGSRGTGGNAYVGGPRRAFLWQNGRTTDLGALPGDLFSDAVGINDAGQILGWSSVTSVGPSHVLLWTLRPTAGRCPALTPPASGDSVRVRAASITVAGRIGWFDVDAGRAIVLTEQRGACADVLVWNRARQKVVTVFDRRLCPGTLAAESTGPAALAGTTAAYLHTATGNTQETTLVLKSLATGRVSGVSKYAGGQGAYGDAVGDVVGGDGLLAYDDQTMCGPDVGPPEIPCPGGADEGTIVSDRIHLVLPVHRLIAVAPHALDLLAVGGGRLVIGDGSGRLLVLAPGRGSTGLVRSGELRAENVIATFTYRPYEARHVATDGRTLAVLRSNGALDLLSLHGGTPSSLRLHADDLAGVDGKLVAYVVGRSVHVLDSSTGSDVVVARLQSGPVHARLVHDGLYVSGWATLSFMPRGQVVQRLRRP